jgi:hypothetical protein
VLTEQHGVKESTIRRDEGLAGAVEVLGLQDEIVAGKVSAPQAALVEAVRRCKRLQPNPHWQRRAA